MYFQLHVLHLRSCASIPLFRPHAATAFLLRLTGTADRGGALERCFELKLSFTFSCSFAASDPIWLAHRSLQGLSWVAHGQPQLKTWAGLLPQFHWVWLWMAAVLCAVFWGNLAGFGICSLWSEAWHAAERAKQQETFSKSANYFLSCSVVLLEKKSKKENKRTLRYC